jgi:inner membrane protein
MLGKTHMAVGMAAGLMVMRPQNIQELIMGTGAALVGSVIADIDIGTSESHKDADRIICLSILVVGIVAAADCIWNLGIHRRILADSNAVRIVLAAAVFLGVCAFGKEQPHRSFMHSFIALVVLPGCVTVFWPIAAPYFFTAYVSHIAIDLLNKKGEQLIFPFHKRFSMNLCSSKGLVNKLLFQAGSLCTTAVLAVLLAGIYL